MSRRCSVPHIFSAGASLAAHKLAVDLGGPVRRLNMNAGKPVIFHDMRLGFTAGDKAKAEGLIAGDFAYAGQSLNIGADGDPWTLAVPSERFAKWLHSFSWLGDLAASRNKKAFLRARLLADKWVQVYGQWNDFAWTPDSLAQRVLYWGAYWSPLLSGDNMSEAAQLRRNCFMRQLKRLRKTYRRTSPGLARLRASAALVIGGLRLKEKSERYFEQGLDWLDDEIELQILPDGGHISRSPEQSLDALEILLMVDNLLQSRGVQGSRALSRAIDRLAPVISFFTSANGALFCFNGGGEGDARRIKALMKAAPKPAKPFAYCPHTGYQRIAHGGSVLIIDTGSTPPRPFDTQAHLAPLAFELSTELGRLVVNCGWSEQQALHFREFMRSTAAHSTLILDDKSAGRLLANGWKTKILGYAVDIEAGPVSAKRKEQDAGAWLESTHEGYRASIGLTHRRRLYMSPEGDDIRGEDSLFVPLGAEHVSRDQKPFKIRFHFHPDVRVSLSQDQKSALLVHGGKAGWRFRTDGGPLSVEDSIYLGQGEVPIKAQQIVISGNAYCDGDGETRSNRVRWSLRKLEARKT